MQANISTLQTNLQTNTSSPNLVQTTSTNDLPSSDARILVQFNSLASTASTSAIPQDIADLTAVINSTFLLNVDTHVLELDNSTVNASDLVTELRGRDGEANLCCCELESSPVVLYKKPIHKLQLALPAGKLADDRAVESTCSRRPLQS